MDKAQQDFYQKLRVKIKKWIETRDQKDQRWAEYILLAPDIFHLLCKLAMDPEVPASKKVKLGVVIAYFVSPLDFLPEMILGPIGYLDDIALSAFILNDIINNTDPKLITRNWAGERDILELVKTILVNADKMVGSGLWQKLKNKLS